MPLFIEFGGDEIFEGWALGWRCLFLTGSFDSFVCVPVSLWMVEIAADEEVTPHLLGYLDYNFVETISS